MSTWYLILVPRPVRCEACDGVGAIADDPMDPAAGYAVCDVCTGTGRAGEPEFVPHNERIYDSTGTASGVIKRHRKGIGRGEAVEGRDFRLLEIDLDLCEVITTRWPVEQQASHAIDRAVYWTRRAVELGKRAHLPIADTAAGDALQVATDAVMAGRLDEAKEILAGVLPEEPVLGPDDMATVRHALDALVRLGGGRAAEGGLIAAVHLSDDRITSARAVLAKLDAHAALSDLHRQRVDGSTETVAGLAQWASGGGPRRCLRDERRGPSETAGMVWTTCGDLVPTGAATADRTSVACSGCSRAMEAWRDDYR